MVENSKTHKPRGFFKNGDVKDTSTYVTKWDTSIQSRLCTLIFLKIFYFLYPSLYILMDSNLF
jgi:hypothetical protein